MGSGREKRFEDLAGDETFVEVLDGPKRRPFPCGARKVDGREFVNLRDGERLALEGEEAFVTLADGPLPPPSGASLALEMPYFDPFAFDRAKALA